MMPPCRAHLLLEIKMVRQITNNPFLTIQKDIDECRYFEDMYSSATSTTRNYVYTKNLAVGTLPCADNAYCLVSNVDLRQVTFIFVKKFETKNCTNTIGSYFCRCNPGYESRYDENALDYFSSKDTTNIDHTWEKMNDGMVRFSTPIFLMSRNSRRKFNFKRWV